MLKTFADLNFPGRLIAVEGLDGSEVDADLSAEALAGKPGAQGLFQRVELVELVKAATSKGKKRELLSPTTFSLIHATDFADRYEHQHLVPLRAGLSGVVRSLRVHRVCAGRGARLPAGVGAGDLQFCALPDFTFFFKSNLEVSLQRILDGRPQLKYFEGGMDLRLSINPYESFRIFEADYLSSMAMSNEFNFLVIDANQPVERNRTWCAN